MIGRQVTDRARAGVVIAFILLIQEENPMKHPVSAIFLLIALLLPAAPVQAADEIVEKTYCTQGIAYESIDALKLDLLNNAKKAVIDELFGEFIVASTAVENFVVTKDQIQTSSLGFVRVEGNTKFHNGEDFADVCVTIAGYVTDEDRAKFIPEPLDNKYCDADDDMTTSQLIAYVKDETIIQALIEYDPKLKDADKDSLLQLVQKVTYLESGFISDTQTYCAEFEGEVVPVEVMAFLETEPVAETKATPEIEGLVAHYSFDDGTAKDQSENGNDGLIYGDPVSVDGMVGKALEFDGINDYIEVANSPTLNPAQLSIATWVKLVDLPQTGVGGYTPINKELQYEIAILTGSYEDASRHELAFALNPHFYWYGGKFFPEPNQFIHIALVFESSNTALMYVNGIETNAVSYDKGMTSTDNCLRIATRGCADDFQFKPFDFFKGTIDEVRIYNRSLSESEVQLLYEMEVK